MLIDVYGLPYLGSSPYSPPFPSNGAFMNEDRICRVLRDSGLTWMIAFGMSDEKLLALKGMGRTLVGDFREMARYRYGTYMVFSPMGNRQKIMEVAKATSKDD